MQVDFSGKRLWLVDRDSGERTQVDLFVGVLLSPPCETAYAAFG